VLLYAFTLGLVAAVNPCGFPLLPAYLALFARGGTAGPGPLSRTARGLGAGAGVCAGFVAVFGALGAAVESGARVVVDWAPWAMVPFGAAMAGFGVLVLLGRAPHLSLPVPRARSGRPGVVAMASFGVAYAVASLSCALPLFLAAVAGSFTRAGPLAGLGTFAAYALGMGLVLMVASLVVSHAGAAALRRASRLGRGLPRASGAVLAVVGAYLVLYWVSDLVRPASAPAPVRAVEAAQSAVSNWLAASPRLSGLVLGAAVVAALVVPALAHPGPARANSPGAQVGSGSAGARPAPSGARGTTSA